MGKAFFVTGTDTDVGKTLVAAALLRGASQENLRTLGMKPLAAGSYESDQGWVNDDAVMLMANSTVKLPYQQINPVLFDEPIAPHIAAEKAGKRITADRLSGFCRGLKMQPSDFMLIEGAGGWRVPLNSRETLADLAINIQLPVILVVGMRLGCLNHALLTAEAIRRDGLSIAGWVANFVDDMPEADANLNTLKHMLPAPHLGTIPKMFEIDLDIATDHLKDGLHFLLNKN